jgi:hypothetical protein
MLGPNGEFVNRLWQALDMTVVQLGQNTLAARTSARAALEGILFEDHPTMEGFIASVSAAAQDYLNAGGTLEHGALVEVIATALLKGGQTAFHDHISEMHHEGKDIHLIYAYLQRMGQIREERKKRSGGGTSTMTSSMSPVAADGQLRELQTEWLKNTVKYGDQGRVEVMLQAVGQSGHQALCQIVMDDEFFYEDAQIVDSVLYYMHDVLTMDYLIESKCDDTQDEKASDAVDESHGAGDSYESDDGSDAGAQDAHVEGGEELLKILEEAGTNDAARRSRRLAGEPALNEGLAAILQYLRVVASNNAK